MAHFLVLADRRTWRIHMHIVVWWVMTVGQSAKWLPHIGRIWMASHNEGGKKSFWENKVWTWITCRNKICFWKIRMIETSLLPYCQLRIYVLCVKKWNKWVFLVIRHLAKMCSNKKVMEEGCKTITVADCPWWFVCN